MKHLPSLAATDIALAVSMPAAIDALCGAFASRPEHIARTSYAAAGGELLLMPAIDERAAGIKLLMVQPRNVDFGAPVIQGTYVLFDAVAGAPIALLDGAALTNLRTPAVSAVATDSLARADARSLGVFGTGPQCIGHVEAMLCVRPGIDTIVIAGRTRANAAAAVAAIADDRVSVGSATEAAACDIVCTATRSTEALMTAAMVRPGAHINAVGAYRPDMRELATDLIERSTVVVDDLHAAGDEAGDLILAAAEGWSWDRVAGDLADVCCGELARRDGNEISVFKSVGLAVEDLAIARLVAQETNLL